MLRTTTNIPLGKGLLNVASFLLNMLKLSSVSELSIFGDDVRGRLARANVIRHM